MVSQPDPTAQYSLHHSSHRRDSSHTRSRTGSSASSAILPRRSAASAGAAHQQQPPAPSSRSRRYNRSHAGGDSYVPLNEFPVFTHSGDVEIVVRAGPLENRYLLHRHILTRCSGFFEASTSDLWSRARPPAPAPTTKPGAKQLAAGNELARVGSAAGVEDGSEDDAGQVVSAGAGVPAASARKRWRYELDPGSDEDDIPMLVQKDPSGDQTLAPMTTSIFGSPRPSADFDSGPPPARSRRSHSHSQPYSSKGSRSSFSQSLANLALSSQPRGPKPQRNATVTVADPVEQDLVQDYDNLFRIFYNYPPLLDGVNVADAYIQCKRLLNLADQYDSLAVVGPRVDHHLLQFQARLWKQVAKYPVSYLRLGYLARSKVIFQEALVHVVGQWPVGERSLRASLPASVLDLIEDKVDDLEYTVSRVERRLFRLTLLNSRGDRVSPSSNYLDWLVISFFRQWLADNTTPPPPPAPVDPTSFRRRTSSRDGDRNAGGYSTSGSGSSSSASAVAPLPGLGSVGRAYRVMAGRPTGYLPHSACKEFLKLTPDVYSRDNLRRFERRLDELKAMAREVVAPLMGSSLELDLAAGGAAAAGGGSSGARQRDLPWSLDD
ncbi:hypothetical protein K4F52_008612 [Lecanicillium sp. MT-2017a]|nr:hypothetical protein K4F52_008612 [Lecanicillium sp. MT-2017a]